MSLSGLWCARVYNPHILMCKPVLVYSVVKTWLCKTVFWAIVFATNQMSLRGLENVVVSIRQLVRWGNG